MAYQIAICDDDETQLRTLRAQVSKWSAQAGQPCDIQCFPSAESFLFAYDGEKTYDILLLDVEMKEISGIGLARRIRKDNQRAEIIFITSHFEFISEGYEVDALHYLIKPITEAKLMEVLSKAARKLSVEPPSLVIVCNGETVKILEPDILYIESFRHYVVVHTQSTEYKLKENLSALKGKLSSDFYQTHRSYLVSLKHIRKISRTAVWLDCGAEIPLARGKYDDVNRAFIARN